MTEIFVYIVGMYGHNALCLRLFAPRLESDSPVHENALFKELAALAKFWA